MEEDTIESGRRVEARRGDGSLKEAGWFGGGQSAVRGAAVAAAGGAKEPYHRPLTHHCGD